MYTTMDILNVQPGEFDTFQHFIGQERIKDELRILVDGSIRTGNPIIDLLFIADSGMGKSRLARTVVKESGNNVKIIQGVVDMELTNFTGILNHIQEGDILLVHHIDRIDSDKASILRSVIEKGYFNLVMGDLLPRFDIKPFTLIGLSSNQDKIDHSLRAALKEYTFEPYSTREIIEIVNTSIERGEKSLNSSIVITIADLSNGSPDHALLLMRRAIDYIENVGAQYVDVEKITQMLQEHGDILGETSDLLISEALQNMSGSEFERFIASVFTEIGYQVEIKGGAGDKGVDVLAKRDNEIIAIQCKRWDDAVSPNVVRDLYGGMEMVKANQGGVATTSTFSEEAIETANQLSIGLMDLAALIDFIKIHNLEVPSKQ